MPDPVDIPFQTLFYISPLKVYLDVSVGVIHW